MSILASASFERMHTEYELLPKLTRAAVTKPLLALALFLWLISLSLPALKDSEDTYWGFMVLQLGWVSLWQSPAWFANIIWVGGGALVLKGNRYGVILALLGFLLGAHALTLNDENSSLEIGYWIWMLVPFPVAVAGLWPNRRIVPISQA